MTRKFEKRNNRYRKEPDTEKIVCKCPMCEKDHEQYLKWIGRGKPRIYCKYCYAHRAPCFADLNAATGMNVSARKRRYG